MHDKSIGFSSSPSLSLIHDTQVPCHELKHELSPLDKLSHHWFTNFIHVDEKAFKVNIHTKNDSCVIMVRNR